MIGTPPSTRPLHADDVVLFAGLVARGDSTTRRRWVHHLYLPDRAAALRARQVLQTLGWGVLLCDAMPAPCPGWRLRVYRDTVVEPVKVNRARVQMDRAARVVGGTYDGWDDLPVPQEQRVLTIA